MHESERQVGYFHRLLQRKGIRTLLVALVLHALASWTFVLINSIQNYALDLPSISQNRDALSTPLWIPALLLYELFSLLTSLSGLSKCAMDWLDYLLPFLGWWGLLRFVCAAIRRAKSQPLSVGRRSAYRAFAALLFGLAVLFIVNALALHFGLYVVAGKWGLHGGFYKKDGCAILEIYPVERIIRMSDPIFQYPRGISWEKHYWPSGFWLILKVPLWVLSVPLAGLSLFTLYRLKRAAANETFCKKCSYDLRSHAPGDKCPECGTPIPNRPAPPAKPA